LWSTVLMANLAGASLFALGLASGKFVDRTVIDTCTAVALASVEGSALDFFLRGIVSGWLIALMVWMLPSAQQSRLTIIVAITYLVALADLSHVVAGAVDVFYLAFRHVHSFGAAFGYIGPTLLGNVLGGIALTAALNHAQTVAPSLQT
jgi:formate/nitrite transporter FocA (FNT family)